MGICCSSLEPETPTNTAKVIHQDGRLQEFNNPVKVSHVIDTRHTFICNSDDMEFGALVNPVLSTSELQPGQLYFALPVCRLREPLTAEEMAGLAVKAHAALLMRTGGGGTKCKKTAGAVVFYGEEDVGEKQSSIGVVIGGRRNNEMGIGIGIGKKNGGGGGGGGIDSARSRRRRKVFAANLSSIEE